MPPVRHSLDEVAERLVSGLDNSVTRAMYGKAIRDFLAWHTERSRPSIKRSLLETYRAHLAASGYSASTINQRLSAIRKLLLQAGDEGVLRLDQAVLAARVSGVSRRGVRHERSLDFDDAEKLVNAPDPRTQKGLRDRAMLALLIGCGLRRAEVVSLQLHHLNWRQGRWVLAGVDGKHGRTRTVPLPSWVKIAIDAWVRSAQISEGPLFRAVDRKGTIGDRTICAQTVFDVVARQAKKVGLSIRPHDLRRTFAKLCRTHGGDLAQIQLLLGHSRPQVTESYLGTREGRIEAPNERIPIRWHTNHRELAS